MRAHRRQEIVLVVVVVAVVLAAAGAAAKFPADIRYVVTHAQRIRAEPHALRAPLRATRRRARCVEGCSRSACACASGPMTAAVYRTLRLLTGLAAVRRNRGGGTHSRAQLTKFGLTAVDAHIAQQPREENMANKKLY